ncbi:MAG TPA: hypothetical protein VGA13_06530 [Acidimicrobiales bacterium]
MTTFSGFHEHSIDAKGRMILPAEYRDAFEDGVWVTPEIDRCLALRTEEEFVAVAAEYDHKAGRGHTQRHAARLFHARAKEIVPDKHGRMVIPERLRSYANLTDRVVVVGFGRRVEIWDADMWADIEAQADASLGGGDQSLDDLPAPP